MNFDSVTVHVHPRWLRIGFAGGTADFHHRWLRHNGDGDRHPLTHERTLDASEISRDVEPQEIRVDDGVLRIRWPDGWQGYPLSFLLEHAYARDRRDAPPPPSDVAAIELQARDFASVAALVARARQVVEARGAVVVRGFSSRVDPRTGRIAAPHTPADDTEPLVDAFEATGLRIISTHFGRIEDLRPDNTTNQNTDQLGYTNAGIELHTDQPFLDHPPHWQILQGIVTAKDGGQSFLCDAQAAAAYLESVDAPAYRLLTTIPVVFHRKQKAFERTVVSPVITPEGPRGFVVRYSYFTLAPHRVAFDTMDAFYDAWNAFADLVRNPAHQYRFQLHPGDFVVYDNLRMLHGRTAFSGPRWLRGIYLDR